MQSLDTYRDEARVRAVCDEIARVATREWTLMEVCGGQTHSIMRYGIDQLLPKQIELVHGPGCPVCVTPLEVIDRALAIAARPDVIFTSFGDMLRVPGSTTDLFQIKAKGGDVRIVYSPLDALQVARANPGKQVVFFAVGFETTAPANGMAVFQARREGLKNFSILVSHALVPPAIIALLSDPENRVKGFLAAGHVCAVMGYREYEPLAEKYRVPIVVTGFEPLDIANGILACVRQLEECRAQVENAYPRAVLREGNVAAQKLIAEVYQVCDRKWRGIGEIPASGWRLRDNLREFDAELRFDVGDLRVNESPLCISGLVLQGRKKPNECVAFGKQCTPAKPLGATMVSTEGACAAYYRYARHTFALVG
ncbi:MAG: hydrogenase formation protein HypD [Chloroflexi bacterium]|nr:hydrogenase formation protein HypD [Chloroflexota bacterium]